MNEKQIEAVLALSQKESISDAIQVENKDEGPLAVDIDHTQVNKVINWSRISTYACIPVFILSMFIITDPFSLELFGRISIIGLIAILCSNFLSTYKGGMWYMGRVGTRITSTSPASLIKLIGWAILLLPLILNFLG